MHDPDDDDPDTEPTPLADAPVGGWQDRLSPVEVRDDDGDI